MDLRVVACEAKQGHKFILVAASGDGTLYKCRRCGFIEVRDAPAN